MKMKTSIVTNNCSSSTYEMLVNFKRKMYEELIARYLIG